MYPKAVVDLLLHWKKLQPEARTKQAYDEILAEIHLVQAQLKTFGHRG